MFVWGFDTRVGRIHIAGQEHITMLYLPSDTPPEDDAYTWQETPLVREAGVQVCAYLEGRLRTFSLPLALNGSAYLCKVWRALCDIPYGHTATYGEIAARCGNPKAARAVGLANNRNPIPIIVPCHRVVGSNGRLVGYRGGLALKQQLLALETAGQIIPLPAAAPGRSR